MSIQSEITRITNNVQDTIDVIEQTGVSIPAGANSDNLPSLAQALANEKQDKLTGTQGQVVGFDEDGNAVPQAAGVTSFNGRTGAVTPQEGDYTADMVGARPDTWTPSAADVGAVPTSRTVNGKALSQDISLSASDVGARPDTWTPSASEVGAVPTSRTVNGKALSADISLTASDVGARASTWTPTASDVGAVPTSRTVNGKALSSNITLTADDVNAASPPSSTTITLSASAWTSSGTRYQQSVSVSGVTADSIVFVDPDLTVGDNSNVLSAWSGIALYPATQGAGTLTFYTDTQPTVDVPVNVVVM